MIHYEHAGALPRLYQAISRKLRNCLANYGAADAEGFGQLTFGGQFLARRKLTRKDLGAQWPTPRASESFGLRSILKSPAESDAMPPSYLNTLGSQSDIAGM